MCRTIEDRINDLPEELVTSHILNHLLSVMSTKDALRTSVLSREWEYKWISFTRNIDIDDKVSYKQHDELFMGKESTVSIFINFVDYIVGVSRDIRSFALRLACAEYEFWQIRVWISAMLARNIESLVLVYNHGSNQNFLPTAFHYDTSLRNLELRLRCTFRVHAHFSFPNLKNLILSEVEIVNGVSNSDTMTLTFPLLETMALDNSPFLKAKMVEVHAPSLTTFHRTMDVRPEDDYSIEIVSKKLVEFKFIGSVPEKFILIGHQVVRATLRYSNRCSPILTKMGIRAQTLLNVFSSLKELEISGYLTWVIVDSAVGVSLPVLHHLERLVVYSDITHAKGLLEFLYKAPGLKYLKMDTSSVAFYDYNMVEHVPLCVKDRLAEIEWCVDNDDSDITHQLDLFKFILENGRALKKVSVNGWIRATKDKILEQLREFSRSTYVTFIVT